MVLRSKNFRSHNDVYVDSRWENEYRFAEHLPEYLQKKLDNEKGLFQRYDEYMHVTGERKMQGDTQEHSTELVQLNGQEKAQGMVQKVFQEPLQQASLMERYQKIRNFKPEWHAPWKLSKVIIGHGGWVRCACVDPVDNEWFATGSSDTTIKLWDLGTGKLKVTLSGHIMSVRDVVISKRHPYMFSASEDKLVKCWDLETKKPIRDFHGHLSGVHTVDVHPTLDIICLLYTSRCV